MADVFNHVGMGVEIYKGGAWYEGKVVKCVSKKSGLLKVEFNTLVKEESHKSVVEKIKPKLVRPSCPEGGWVNFQPKEKVDVLYEDGWWKAKIKKVHEDGKITVKLEENKLEVKCERNEVRVHRIWLSKTSSWLPA